MGLEAGEKPKSVEGPDASGKPELIYFAAPGRGELARIAFAAGGVEFTDTRLTFQEWPGVKQDPESVPAKMFGSMPVIKHGNFLVAQSISISQYAADLGINAVTPPSAEQRGLDTMILGAHADLQVAMYACLAGRRDLAISRPQGLGHRSVTVSESCALRRSVPKEHEGHSGCLLAESVTILL